MSRVSLSTVAREAGVSKTTASLALNGKGSLHHLSQATISRITKIADRLQYKPHKLILNSFNGSSMVIGLLAHGFNHSQDGEWLEYLIHEAHQYNYQIITTTFSDTPQGLTNSIKDFTHFGVDGLILLSANTIEQQISPLDKKTDIPIILAAPPSSEDLLPHVTDDYAGGMTLLIDYLFRHSKRAIGFLGCQSTSYSQKKKQSTYLENYCQRFGIPPNIELLTSPKPEKEEVVSKCFALIEKGANSLLFSEADWAVMAFSDNTLRPLLTQSIFCAAYGHHPCFQMISENLIYCKPNIQQKAKEVMKILIKKMKEGSQPHSTVNILPYL